MYSDVRSLNILRGPTAKLLPVTGAMLIGWNIVAAVVLISVGLALISISRVMISRARSDEDGLVVSLAQPGNETRQPI